MSSTSKCAHPACNCIPPDGEKYCSDTCANAKEMTELACQCKHAGCQGSVLTA